MSSLKICSNIIQGRGPDPGLLMIPYPRKYEALDGSILLTERSRIVVLEKELVPLAEVLSEEISVLTGISPRVELAGELGGDIVLDLDCELESEEYSIDARDRVVITGKDYDSVALGTVTLLQSISCGGDHEQPEIASFHIEDRPDAAYRGLMVDIARQWHQFKTLKQLVILCRWYKIRYLHLHLSDDQSFTFPSTAFPELPTPNRHYTLEQLHDLEAFARRRGVTIIPELDVPGHSRAAVRAMPERLASDPPRGNVICPGREEVYSILETLVGEICEVFSSTPYFHIGCDEVNKSLWSDCRDCREYMGKNGIDTTDELYRHFIVRMHEIVQQQGKETIVWEGFSREGTIEIPQEIIVMVFETMYNLPQDLLADGYRLINTSWQPLYVTPRPYVFWSPEQIYNWNMYRWEHWSEKSAAHPEAIELPQTDQVLGAQLCSWEMEDCDELPELRYRLPALSERVWDHGSKRGIRDLAQRIKAADGSLGALLCGHLLE